jgi:hypothetical protein
MEFLNKSQIESTNSENHNSNDQSNEVKSFNKLIDQVKGRYLSSIGEIGDSGLAENISYPFSALVSQSDMKLALQLTLVIPHF